MIYTDRRKDNALLRPFKKHPNIIINRDALIVIAITSLTKKKLIDNYEDVHQEVSDHLYSRTLHPLDLTVEGKKYLLRRYTGKYGGCKLFDAAPPKPQKIGKSKGMSIDEMKQAITNLVVDVNPNDLDEDENGQLIIYTGIYRHRYGSYHLQEASLEYDI